ncbi:MAG: hypothetical protein P4L85_19630 [Paludisphaera borealis]|uniref:hypothetical protein n=1 Tax=Paludisphaera borealis TaxID=1387353 RepID=UPI002843DE18|nr:hypothetical protein [Paludisphaera borealis]MDR3621572.1 hypothetical protein [Paludisphaera borealis]
MTDLDRIKAAVDEAVHEFVVHFDYDRCDDGPNATFTLERAGRNVRVNMHVELLFDEPETVDETYSFPAASPSEAIRGAVLKQLQVIERAGWRDKPADLAGRVKLERVISMFDGTPAERMLRGA